MKTVYGPLIAVLLVLMTSLASAEIDQPTQSPKQELQPLNASMREMLAKNNIVLSGYIHSFKDVKITECYLSNCTFYMTFKYRALNDSSHEHGACYSYYVTPSTLQKLEKFAPSHPNCSVREGYVCSGQDCISSFTAPNQEKYAAFNFLTAVVEHFRTSLVDPYSVRDFAIGAVDCDIENCRVCARYNARNRSGGYVGTNYTILTTDQIGIVETATELTDGTFEDRELCRSIKDGTFNRVLENQISMAADDYKMCRELNRYWYTGLSTINIFNYTWASLKNWLQGKDCTLVADEIKTTASK
jgi:hypothetical protein